MRHIGIIVRHALVARQPDGHRQFPLFRAFRRKIRRFLKRKTCFLQPIGHCLMRKAEAGMRVLVAQIFKSVRREIYDHEPATGREHARGLGDRRLRLFQEMQHLMDRDEIKGLAVERKVEDVAVADRSLGDAGLVEIGACHCEHVAAGIDADAAPVDALEELQDAASARAKVE